MGKKQKKMLARILVSAVLFAAGFFLPLAGWSQLVFYLTVYAIIGWDIVWKAVRNIAHGQVFDENFLMALATIGAFCLQEFPEAVEVMLFYQVGELFQSYAVGRSRQSIAALMDIRPDYANIERDGKLEQVDPDDVAVGDTIVIKAGERIPLDGVVLDGNSTVNTAALTGESLPRDVGTGSDVISGCVNQSGLLRVRVTKEFGESTVSKILDLVENSSTKKAKAENFITKFARYYTPAVVIGAVLLAVLPPLLGMGMFSVWVARALTFLVISCPCALVISIPLSFFGGIGGASKRGILVKGSNYLEALAQTETVVFDKTGTLTRGTFQVTAVHPARVSREQLLELAALAESFSDHPISRSLKEAYGRELDNARVSDVEEISGHGVCARVDGRTVCAGNGKLMDKIGAQWHECHKTGTVVHVAVDGEYAGHIVISDAVKPDAARAIASLKRQGIRKTVMLTGDAKAVGESVAKQLGLDEVHAELLPADKVERVEALQNRNGDAHFQKNAAYRASEHRVFTGCQGPDAFIGGIGRDQYAGCDFCRRGCYGSGRSQCDPRAAHKGTGIEPTAKQTGTGQLKGLCRSVLLSKPGIKIATAALDFFRAAVRLCSVSVFEIDFYAANGHTGNLLQGQWGSELVFANTLRTVPGAGRTIDGNGGA